MEYGLALLWLLAFAALGALALPLAAWLLRPLPDDGAGLAVPVAVAVLGLVGFWVGRLAFGWPALIAGLLVLAGLSYAATRRGAEPDLRRFGEAMAVFTVAFLFLLAVRALDPAVHPGGGEKFLDFGMLSALARTPRLPPEDFWFAGEPVAYYYGGHMIAALLARLTGTAPRFAYNLALPGFYAAFVTAAYSLAGAIAAERDRSRVSAGVFAAFLVALASNLATPLRALAYLVGSPAPLRLFGLEARWAGTVPGDFSYWTASRVISLGAIQIPSEFPLFAYLNGDLHAHMMSPPLTLLLAGVLYAYWRTPAADLTRRRLLVFAAVPPLSGLVAVVNTWSFPTTLGLAWLALALAPTDPRELVPGVGPSPGPTGRDADTAGNPSDPGAAQRPATDPAPDGGAPTGAVARVGDELVRTATAVGLTVVLAALAAVWVLPFLTGTTSGRGVGFVAPGRRSGLESLLVVHGAFLLLAVRFLGGRLAAGSTQGAGRRVTLAALAAAAGAFALVALGTLLAPLLTGTPLRALGVVPFLALVAVGWVLVRADGDGGSGRRGARVGYETALFVGAAGLVALVEFVYVTDTGPGRFNTVFKTYAQVWALLSVAGGVVLAEYADPAGWVRALVPDPGSSVTGNPVTDGGPDRAAGTGGPTFPSVGGVLAAALVLTLSVYGAFALAGHVSAAEDHGPATLDALRFAERDHSLEWPAVEYVRDLEGTPTVVTAPAERMYRWSSDYWVRRTPPESTHEMAGGAAPASLSGVPTLAGWAHEIGYRGEADWRTRVGVVNSIYGGTPAEQAELLAEHDVAYVYVGPAECQRYGDPRLDRLTGVEPVPESADWEYVTIYRVDQDALGVAESGADGTGDPGVDPCEEWE